MDTIKLPIIFEKLLFYAIFLRVGNFSKVIFYLWNDVFKDNDTSLFKLDNSNREPSFDEFYTEDEDGNTIANQEAISKFICNVLGKEYKSQDDTNE